MTDEKVTRQVQAKLSTLYATENSTRLSGYEIHSGETRPFGEATPSPLLHLNDERDDGTIVDEKCFGTYVHGILDNPSFIEFLLSPYHEKIEGDMKSFDYQAYKEEQYDLLAAHVRKYVDMERIYEILRDYD